MLLQRVREGKHPLRTINPHFLHESGLQGSSFRLLTSCFVSGYSRYQVGAVGDPPDVSAAQCEETRMFSFRNGAGCLPDAVQRTLTR